jgi:hypothetical protein
MGSSSTRYWQKGFGRKSFKFQDFNEVAKSFIYGKNLD